MKLRRDANRNRGDMLLSMHSNSSRIHRPAQSAGKRRGWRLARTAALRGLVASSLCLLCLIPAHGQAQDEGLGSGQIQQQPPITPAPGVPANSTPPELIFPESNVPTMPSGRSTSRMSVPLGPSSGAGLGYGPIHPGDIVEVQIFDAPEYGMRMPVSGSGDIAIPYAGLFHISGMTSVEAAKAIAKLFRDREILSDPHVIVTTQQYGYSVTVLGEIRSPGIYPLAGQQRLIDIVTEAGGLTDRAGHIIEIFGAGSMTNPTTLLWDPTLRENDNAEVKLKPGETVLVSRCGVVYVGGNVGRPGAFPLCESNHTTISEVMALAQGIKPNSYGQRTLLLRTTEAGTRLVQKVRVEDVLRGKRADITLQPDDILFVPPSGLKAVSKIALGSAIGFATQAYFYLH